jgi:PKD repeat protein
VKKSLARLGVGLLAALSLAWSTLAVAPAKADTRPPNPADPKTPVTVAADPLPTVQIDGVAWTQRVIGNTVYVGGRFTTARPAGAAAGTSTTPRANLLAYDIRTGALISAWAPTTNGDVLSIVPSPDNTRLYIGGSFTTVNGQTRNRIAALDRATGNLIGSFQPKPDATVRAIAATSETVYFGGLLSAVGGVARARVASARASDGALLSWAPSAQGGSVHSLALSPNNSQLIIGGSFTTLNGSANPGYGLASVSPTTGALLPFAANSLIRNGGPNSAITGLSVDADSLYISGFVFGSGGNLEGVSRVDWNGGVVKWVEDCHGDTYGSFPKGDVIYVSSHAHYCGNLPDGFPQTDPWTQHYGTAFTKAVTGTLGRDPLGYFNWEGNPAPSLLKWIPALTNGTFTGQGQAGWNVTGNADYVTIGGEFPRAGSVAQQGLVRYAVREIAPNKIGPEFTGSKFNPNLASWASGTVKISWPANWDRDNEQLTYSVIRNGDIANPIYTTTQVSSEWNRPAMGFLDEGLVPGQTYRYRVFAKDPWGNEARSDTVSIVASAEGTISPYARSVLNDEASSYWRLGESSGTAVTDWAGFDNASLGTGVTRGAAGAIAGDANRATTFDGTTNGRMASGTKQDGLKVFTTEAWFRTNTTRGGKIIGFGNQNATNSGSFDRHVYMTNTGRLVFGVYPGSVQTITSTAAYNDNQWHHVVASLSPSGMALFVDGASVASRADVTTAQGYMGYWRVGGDSLGSWPSAPTSAYFAGTIDDVAVYPRALSAAEVQNHFARGQGQVPNEPPTANFTFAADNLAVRFTGTSTDSDGTIAAYAWDFGDGGTSTAASPDHRYAQSGSYQVKLTVTDDDGDSDSVTKTVTAAANVKPTAAYTSSTNGLAASFNGTSSSDSDGTIASYAWDFGDGATSTAAQPNHTYAAAGSYQVTLTVTDDDGATDAVTKAVTISVPVGPLAEDAFGRTVTDGWGTADTGGAWTRYGTASIFSVNNGAGQMRVVAGASGPRVALQSVGSTSTRTTVKVSADKIADGGGSFVSVGGRATGTNDYRAKVKIASNGVLTLYLVRVVNNAETTLVTTNLGSAFNYTVGSTLQIRLEVSGTSPTTVRAKVWKTTQTEPSSWQLTTTDSTAGLQTAGGIALVSYLTSTVTNLPVTFRFDDLQAVNIP